MQSADPDIVMADHGFPPGLLPRPVVSSRYDVATGTFEVTLGQRVVRQVDRYRVRYGTVIRGRIVADAITELSGVQAKKGLWFPVSRILARGEKLAFQVGPVVKHLPVDAFS